MNDCHCKYTVRAMLAAGVVWLLIAMVTLARMRAEVKTVRRELVRTQVDLHRLSTFDRKVMIEQAMLSARLRELEERGAE